MFVSKFRSDNNSRKTMTTFYSGHKPPGKAKNPRSDTYSAPTQGYDYYDPDYNNSPYTTALVKRTNSRNSYRDTTAVRSTDGYGANSDGSFSGYGHGGGYGHGHGHGHKCCPLVIDALCLAAILGALAGATLFLANLIAMSLRRRKRRDLNVIEPFNMVRVWQIISIGKTKAKRFFI